MKAPDHSNWQAKNHYVREEIRDCVTDKEGVDIDAHAAGDCPVPKVGYWFALENSHEENSQKPADDDSAYNEESRSKYRVSPKEAVIEEENGYFHGGYR